jgi:hypothetical protein
MTSKQKNLLGHTLIWVTLLTIGLAYIESAVVVYLRELLFPHGFTFPMPVINHIVIKTEIWRELATLLILTSIGAIVGKHFLEKFAWFIYSFAVWDIFYYVFLKLLIDWPESFMTWDILFLIPVTWAGPVITPLIVTVLMIILSFVIFYYESKNKAFITWSDWSILLIGSILLIIAFCWDYTSFIFKEHTWQQLNALSNEELTIISASYVPQSFNWWMFLIAVAVLSTGITCVFIRSKKQLASFDSN